MATSFGELGIPFPLFEAPVEEASEYVRLNTCTLCGQSGRDCFDLSSGAVVVQCGQCGTENGLNAIERADEACRRCGATLRFPLVAAVILTCYECLRSGKAAITKVTELGMVSWEQAFEGMTHGKPGLHSDDFETVSRGDGWTGVRLPRSVMYELLRPPTYSSIQGERWLFCCRQPMVYVGEWSREDFTRHAPDGDGGCFFSRVVRDTVPGLWEDELHDLTSVYVFRCPGCGEYSAHWDMF